MYQEDFNMKDSGRKTSYKRKELGASVIGSLIPGIKGFKTSNEVLEDALNEYQGKEAKNDLANNPKVKAGQALEPAITQMFVNELQSIAKDQKAKFKISVPEKANLYSLDNGKLGSSLDNLLTINNGSLEVTDHNKSTMVLSKSGPVEIKNYSGSAEDPVNPLYVYQLQQQMLCTGSTWGIIVRLVKGWELQWYVYERNTEMCNDIINAATDFWNRFDGILEGKDYWYPPETTEEATKIFKGSGNKEPVIMDSNNMLSELIDEFMNASKTEKDAKAQKDEASKAIKTIMKEHEVISFNGFIVSHTSMTRKKTKMVEVPGADPIVTRRFSIKDVR
jgi:hypothetical protein